MSTSLPTFDKTLGLKLAGGKAELAKDMIDMLKAQLPKDLNPIEAAHASEDWAALQVAVHKLHGAACYCGTPALKQASADLELALMHHQTDKIPALYEQLITAIHHILNTPYDID